MYIGYFREIVRTITYVLLVVDSLTAVSQMHMTILVLKIRAKGFFFKSVRLYIVARQRGGVSIKPPYLRAATRHGLLTL